MYYGYRHATGEPLWTGLDAFERLLAEVLCCLSRGFELIAPIRLPKRDRAEDQPLDPRSERFQQPSCRIFLMPPFDRPGSDD